MHVFHDICTIPGSDFSFQLPACVDRGRIGDSSVEFLNLLPERKENAMMGRMFMLLMLHYELYDTWFLFMRCKKLIAS